MLDVAHNNQSSDERVTGLTVSYKVVWNLGIQIHRERIGEPFWPITEVGMCPPLKRRQ